MKGTTISALSVIVGIAVIIFRRPFAVHTMQARKGPFATQEEIDISVVVNVVVGIAAIIFGVLGLLDVIHMKNQ